MNDIITVRGFVATEPKSSTTPAGTGTASFRLGSTERKFDRSNDAWVDGHTNWFRVQAFRHLAGNIGCSVKKGQRVIVVGKLKLREWEHDGKIYHAAEIVAESVGHDLMWGSANFIRTSGSSSPQSLAAAPEVEPENPWPSVEEDSDGGPHDDDEDGSTAAEREVILSTATGGESVLVNTETGELVDATA